MISRLLKHGLTVCLLAGLALLIPVFGIAQTTTGTIRGTVTGAGGTPAAGVEVLARNSATGAQRSTTTRQDGSYALAGLPPATYELMVRQIGITPQRRIVVVQIGATQVQDFSLEAQAVQISELQVVAAPPAKETRTSEVATNITTEQIESCRRPAGTSWIWPRSLPG
jgi:hypothetical protein